MRLAISALVWLGAVDRRLMRVAYYLLRWLQAGVLVLAGSIFVGVVNCRLMRHSWHITAAGLLVLGMLHHALTSMSLL